jgi:hypothetical protein
MPNCALRSPGSGRSAAGANLVAATLALDTTDEALVPLALGGEARAHTVIGQERREPAGETSQRAGRGRACGAGRGNLEVHGAGSCGRAGHVNSLLAIGSAIALLATDSSPGPVTVPCPRPPYACDDGHTCCLAALRLASCSE